MTPQQAIREAQEGTLRPVYLVAGEELYLQAAVVKALRAATLAGGTPGLNEDQLTAGDATADAVLSAARTLPMMAQRRWVLVRSIERWESKKEGTGKRPTDPLARIAQYASDPAPSTVLVLLALKLDRRRRLYAAAKKAGWLVTCDPLSRRELPAWIIGLAKSQGSRVSRSVAELIGELAGPDLSDVAHAVERVSLYAGQREITEADVAECVVRLRPTEVWDLGNAVGRRDLGAALATLDRVYDNQDRGLRLVGVLAWAARRLVRFEAALRAGLSAERAADQAGAPPFVARELAQQVRRTSPQALERWLETLSDVDLALKGGSRRPPKSVLEHAIISSCRAG